MHKKPQRRIDHKIAFSDRVRNTATKVAVTAGEIFHDGAMIELVLGSEGSNKPDLLLWNGTSAVVAPHVKYRNRNYEAPELSSSSCRAIRLPARCRDYNSLRELFDKMASLFNQRLHFANRESRLLSAFCLSTWLADRLPIAPGLVISGPDYASGVEALRLLGSLCRHSLMLAEVTPAAFRSLPMHLSLTLLINQPELKPNILRMFRASSYRGLHSSGNRGNIIDLYAPKAIFCGTDAPHELLDGAMIHISATPSQSQWPGLSEQLQNKIANEFQPQLLQYRLKNYANFPETASNVSQFSPATRPLAGSLAMCLSQDPGTASDIVGLLTQQDDEIREQRGRNVDSVILEILLRLIHGKNQKEITVKELAKDVNALLRLRGEHLIYSAEEIGWKLTGLHIPRHTTSTGRQVVFDSETRSRVHELARVYEWMDSALEEDCQYCATKEVTHSK